MEHTSHYKTGDVVDGHEDHQRLQRGIPAAEQGRNGPTQKPDISTQFSAVHRYAPFILPSPAFLIMAG